MNILIACDKFKGSLNAQRVTENLKVGIQETNVNANIILTQLADGGDGTLSALEDNFPMQFVSEAADPFGNNIECKAAAFSVDKSKAFIESALIVGLAMLPEEDQNPLILNTYGLGQILDEIHRKEGAEDIIIGLGGTATNDGGAGLLDFFGFDFIDHDGDHIHPVGGNLVEIAEIIPPSNFNSTAKIRLLCDVDNPLCGPNGASYTYGRQKGASESDLFLLEDGVENLGNLISELTKNDVFSIPGYGAAGGLPLALCEFFNAEIVSGSEFLFDQLEIKKSVEWADLIITGEGKIDNQTTSGKAIMPLLNESFRMEKKVYLTCGTFENTGSDGIDKLTRFQLDVMAKELNKNSFNDASELLRLVGNRIGILGSQKTD